MNIQFSSLHDSKRFSNLSLLLRIWKHLVWRRRIQLAILLLVMMVSGAAELLSLGAVVPFLAVLNSPESLWRNSVIRQVAERLGFTEASQLLLPLALVFASAAVLAASVRVLNLWMNGRLAAGIGSDFSSEAYRRILYQPYEKHLQLNSSDVINVATNHTSFTVVAFNSLLQMFSSVVVSLALFAGLLLIDFQIALTTASTLVIAYGALFMLTHDEMRINGQRVAVAGGQLLKALQEGLGSIRDVLLDGTQEYYFQNYHRFDYLQRRLQAKNGLIKSLPRYVLEALALITIAVLGALLASHRGNGVALISLLGGLALGAQKLLPALQQIYRGWAVLSSYNSAISNVLGILDLPLPARSSVVAPLPLCHGIRFEGVYFRYSHELPDVLVGLDLEINRGECIGLIGTTGSGKSTTVDVLMGLLKPTAGRITVDGCDLHDQAYPERLQGWRSSIAHVPQSVYLADSSFAENIAFGVPPQQIDSVRVEQAALRAKISSFIESTPDGYSSFVGERGVRLSGGQRQRIGIARALYRKASVIVLDEATSALDSKTEAMVMDEIENLNDDLTIIMIAHRLSTLKKCSRVIELSNGGIKQIVSPSLLSNIPPE